MLSAIQVSNKWAEKHCISNKIPLTNDKRIISIKTNVSLIGYGRSVNDYAKSTSKRCELHRKVKSKIYVRL